MVTFCWAATTSSSGAGAAGGAGGRRRFMPYKKAFRAWHAQTAAGAMSGLVLAGGWCGRRRGRSRGHGHLLLGCHNVVVGGGRSGRGRREAPLHAHGRRSNEPLVYFGEAAAGSEGGGGV